MDWPNATRDIVFMICITAIIIAAIYRPER